MARVYVERRELPDDLRRLLEGGVTAEYTPPIDVIESEGLLDRAKRLGDEIRHALAEVRAQYPQIAEVRGLGAMIGVEFANPDTGAPDADFAKRVQTHAFESGLLLLTCGIHFNVIRFLMPLTISDAVFGEALDILGKSIRAAARA